jgi:tRNA A-37 threonylcarbamoyl transferase component Bud32
MGEVYEAVHTRFPGRFAIKVLLDEMAKKEDVQKRFRREAEIACSLRHPNIVQVTDFNWLPDQSPYLVMEYLEGEEVDHVLRRLGALPLLAVLDMVGQVASALAAAHEKHIIHRDLKPQNLFLVTVPGDERRVVKILDFGISKMCEATTHLTRQAAVIGTPKYMAPEQACGLIDQIDQRSDEFSLAAITYEMITGRPPFHAESVDAVLFQVVHQEPPPFAQPMPAVEAVVRRGLAKMQDARFPTVRAFHQALVSAVHETLGHTPPPQMVASSTQILSPSTVMLPGATTLGQAVAVRASAPPAPRRRWPVVAGVMAAGAVAAGAWWLRTPPSEVPTITGFVAEPNPVSRGLSTRLTGIFANGNAEIDGAVGRIVSGVPAWTEPEADTRYTLTLANARGEIAKSAVDVSVVPVTVSVFGDFTCMIKKDGTLACWGANDAGQATPPPGMFRDLSSGHRHSCAVRTDGAVLCWGENASGCTEPDPGTYVSVAVNAVHSCGVKTDGSIDCWGGNTAGQQFPPPGSFVAISTGWRHVCALGSDRKIACWGGNDYGQNNAPDGEYVDVSTGYFHSCAVRTDGNVVCWGRNLKGEGKPPVGTFASVGAGLYHTCGLKTDNTVVCWGDNAGGRAAPPPGKYVAVDAGEYHSCGVHTDGSVVCWGANDKGEVTVPDLTVAAAGGSAKKPETSPTKPVKASGDEEIAPPKPKKSARASVYDDMNPFIQKRVPKKSAPASADGDDIFATRDTANGVKPVAEGGECSATISSKPWAEVAIDGKPTGKITPLVNYPLPCGKHRITFTNQDLMIERNETITLKPGQTFKRIFPLAEFEP